MIPAFRKTSGGTLRLDYSQHAKALADANLKRSNKPVFRSLQPEVVKRKAIVAVKALKGNPEDKRVLLGQYRLQFGMFRGQTFKWLAENALGYAAFIAVSSKKEVPNPSNLSSNKFSFLEYLQLFEEGRAAMEIKAKEKAAKLQSQKAQASKAQPTSSDVTGPSIVEKTGFVRPFTQPPSDFPLDFASSSSSSTPPLPMPSVASHSATSAAEVDTLEDNLLYAAAEEIELKSTRANILPKGWMDTLPGFDHSWVAAKFFIRKDDKLRFNYEAASQFWWTPPAPTLIPQQMPKINRYFARPLLLWMPRKLLRAKLMCPNEACNNELTSAGIYPRIRSVLDLEGYYSLAGEYLECSNCKKKVISWNEKVVCQLDLSHQQYFHLVLTYKYACDNRVVKLMRLRRLGNSASQLQRRLAEYHCEHWIRQSMLYLTHVEHYKANSQLVRAPAIEEPPSNRNLPSIKWLLSVHLKDVLHRLSQLQSAITSVYGKILKIDSTKKVPVSVIILHCLSLMLTLFIYAHCFKCESEYCLI